MDYINNMAEIIYTKMPEYYKNILNISDTITKNVETFDRIDRAQQVLLKKYSKREQARRRLASGSSDWWRQAEATVATYAPPDFDALLDALPGNASIVFARAAPFEYGTMSIERLKSAVAAAEKSLSARKNAFENIYNSCEKGEEGLVAEKEYYSSGQKLVTLMVSTRLKYITPEQFNKIGKAWIEDWSIDQLLEELQELDLNKHLRGPMPEYHSAEEIVQAYEDALESGEFARKKPENETELYAACLFWTSSFGYATAADEMLATLDEATKTLDGHVEEKPTIRYTNKNMLRASLTEEEQVGPLWEDREIGGLIDDAKHSGALGWGPEARKVPFEIVRLVEYMDRYKETLVEERFEIPEEIIKFEEGWRGLIGEIRTNMVEWAIARQIEGTIGQIDDYIFSYYLNSGAYPDFNICVEE